MSGEPPVCTTEAELRAHDGERVQVVGTYTVWDPRPLRPAGRRPARQVIITLDGVDGGPYLGAWGHEAHFRDLDEIAALDGRRVRAIGTFHTRMPPHPTDPPEAASIDGPCLHPLESVEPE
jgi:hypothetical protein